MSTPEGFVSLTGYHLGETEKAVRFAVHQVEDSEIERNVQWFPLSQVKSITRAPSVSEMDVLVVKQWIARQKELI